jgi:hypothetical protein
MRPIDYRNATWHGLKSHLHGLRLAAHNAYRDHGPGTTRQVADASGIDILTLRPRTTELFQMGFIELVPDPLGNRSKEGTYRTVSEETARHRFQVRQAEALSLAQPELALV